VYKKGKKHPFLLWAVMSLIVVIVFFVVLRFQENRLQQLAHEPVTKVYGTLRAPAYHPFIMQVDSRSLIFIGVDGLIQLYDFQGTSKVLNTLQNQNYFLASANMLDEDRFLLTGWDRTTGDLFSKVYDLKKNNFSDTKSLNIARTHYVTVQLDSGEILFVGGIKNKSLTGTVELFVPKQNNYKLLTCNTRPALSRKAIKLKNNNVLFIGGYNNTGILNDRKEMLIKEIELFDPKTKSIKQVGRWEYESNDFNLQLLEDGKILIIFLTCSQ
jgi:hypothetical protein